MILVCLVHYEYVGALSSMRVEYDGIDFLNQDASEFIAPAIYRHVMLYDYMPGCTARSMPARVSSLEQSTQVQTSGYWAVSGS